ncbi:MAG TPA: tubulin-like doman-containing protein [Longimicrobiaceae bacterium]|nr:tubulin-like doman-containing protein [Longimicrobiaceae bacterium]
MSEVGKIVGNATLHDGIERIRPTLLIGLGGTGREVLLRVRQRMVERYGVPRFPAMAHLWIDTDVDDPEGVTGKPKDFLTAESRLEGPECLDATINADQFLSYFADAQQNPHIFSWIYPGVRRSGSVLHGARAVRPLGRLAFFHRAEEIRRRIVNAVRDITDARRREEMRERYGIEVATDSVQAVLVFSVAGGTGSGMFLDTAFMLRHLARTGQIPSVNSLGFLVLPSVFAPPTVENERFYANAYAALKELEYYSARKDQRHDPVGGDVRVADRVREVSAHDLQVDWERTGPATIVGPPFNSCFLVGNAPAGGEQLPADRKGDLFDMIAESVFIDFSRQRFAEQKRSMRSNLEDYLKNDLEYSYFDGNEVVYREVFSFRFSTFGLSKVYIPVDRIRRACGYRMAVDLLDRWLTVHQPQGDLLGYLEENEAEVLSVRVGRGRDDLRARLDRMNDAGQTLADAIHHHWVTSRLAELRDKVAEERPGLMPALADEFNRFQRAFLNKPDDETRWGSLIRRLRQVTGPQLRQELEGLLIERIHAWSNEERVRLALAEEFLKTLNQILAGAEELYRKASQGRAQSAEQARRDWDAQLAVIDEEETQGPWVHRWSLRALVEEGCRTAAQHFEHAAYAELYAVGAEVLADLQRLVGSERVEVDARGEERIVRSGLVHRIYSLREQLADLRGELAHRLDAFDRAEDHLVFTNLYQRGMFNRFYELVRPDGSTEPINPRALRELELQLRDHLEVLSPFDLLERLRRDGAAAVQAAVEAFCAPQFRRMQETNADAVAFLYSLQDDGEGRGAESRPGEKKPADVIRDLARNGTPWLRTNHRAQQTGSQLLQNYAVASLLGIDHGQRERARYAELEAAFTRLAQDRPMLKNTHPSPVDISRDAVFFYTELAGLPLACIEGLDKYREAYRHKVEEFLHLDRHTDRFADVALKDQEEVRLAVRVTQAVLLGVILRVLEVAGKGDDAALQYVDGRSFPPHRRHIGTRLDALELLSGDHELLATIESAIEERIKKLDVTRMEQFFLLLAWHVLDGHALGVSDVGPFAPRDVRVGDATAQKVPLEKRAIDLTMRKLEGDLVDRGAGPADGSLDTLRERVFRAWYGKRLEFGMEVQLGRDTLLGFRDDPSRPIAIPVHEQPLGSVLEPDAA